MDMYSDAASHLLPEYQVAAIANYLMDPLVLDPVVTEDGLGGYMIATQVTAMIDTVNGAAKRAHFFAEDSLPEQGNDIRYTATVWGAELADPIEIPVDQATGTIMPGQVLLGLSSGRLRQAALLMGIVRDSLE